MDHVSVLKRAFLVTWRYRALWLFGFFLALCSGGSGGGSGNYSPPSSSGDDFYMPMGDMPNIDWQMIAVVIAALICLVLLAVLLGIVVRAVTRTSLIGMVAQVSKTESVTIKEGWRFGWSKRAWRLFLVGIIIGIPVAIISFVLIMLAFTPLLLLFSQETTLIVVAVILTIFAFLFVMLILVVIGAIVTPIMELSWRRTVLDEQGVIESLSETFGFIKHHFKDVAIIWLLMLGVGLLWVMIVFVVVLPISLLAALLVGGIPALLVYLVSGSFFGAAVTGAPLAILAMVLVISFLTGLYLIFRSSVWTLAYLDMQALEITPNTVAGAAPPEPPLVQVDPQTE